MTENKDKVLPIALLLLFIVLILWVVRTSIFSYVEEDKHIYFEIVFLLLLAVLGELAVAYTKQPSVMILMLLGILMSGSFLSFGLDFLRTLNLPFALPLEPPNILRSDDVIRVFAQLGAVILLFKVGLHSKIEKVFSMDNLVVAVCGVILPFAAGYIYATASGGEFAYSMFLGAALTATSVGVTVAILREFKLIEQRFAQIIIGAAVIDDILGLLVLSFVINVSGSSGESAIEPLIFTLISAVVFLFGSIVAGDYFIKYLDRKEMSAKRLMIVLAFMLFYAYVAEFIKLSAIVGAFIAGIILNRSRHINEIEEKTYALELVFMPIFFITMGMLVDINALAQFAMPIIVLTIIAIITKVIGCGGGALLAKLDNREALLVGVGMAPRGEVALIIASIGFTSGILTVAQYSIISAMALLTTFAAPPILGMLLKKKAQADPVFKK